LWGNVTNGAFKIEWFVYAQTAAYSLTAIFAFSIVMVKASFRKLNWNWPFILMILKKKFTLCASLFADGPIQPD
jgi:hypothetical protein